MHDYLLTFIYLLFEFIVHFSELICYFLILLD